MAEPYILHMLSPQKHVSPFDVNMARDAGFADVSHLSGAALAERYLAGRTDGLRPSSGENLIVATT